MTVIEYAKQLGEAIAKDEVLVKFNEAKKAYEENLELQHFVFEYNTQRTILGNEFKKELSEQNEELINLVKAKTDELFTAITEHEIYKDFIKAQEAVNKL
ncbi:MAG: YlbF family regulator, partial [Ruminococcaceae bacterium]|nr:YlbF family regulator [Oscillospiraceae bacterium]